MVIGNGLLAGLFNEYFRNNDIIIFASGVSNSSETSEKEFDREKKLIFDCLKKYPNKKFVYFSTCAFYDKYFPLSPYTLHKKHIEKLISTNCSKYIIFRVPQIIGSSNKSQLLGFINYHIKSQKKFILYDVERNLIDLDYILKVVNFILKNNSFNNCILNLSYPYNISVREIVKIFETITGSKGLYEIKKIKGSFIIKSDKLLDIYHNLNLIIPNYYENKIKLYYNYFDKPYI